MGSRAITSRGSATAKDGGRCRASVIAMPSESGTPCVLPADGVQRQLGRVRGGRRRHGAALPGGFAGPKSEAGEQVAAYAAVLRAVGMRAEPDSEDEQALRVWLA